MGFPHRRTQRVGGHGCARPRRQREQGQGHGCASSPFHVLLPWCRSTAGRDALPLALGSDGEGGGMRRTIWAGALLLRSEEHTSELQSLMRISYAVFCLKKKKAEDLT